MDNNTFFRHVTADDCKRMINTYLKKILLCDTVYKNEIQDEIKEDLEFMLKIWEEKFSELKHTLN